MGRWSFLCGRQVPGGGEEGGGVVLVFCRRVERSSLFSGALVKKPKEELPTVCKSIYNIRIVTPAEIFARISMSLARGIGAISFVGNPGLFQGNAVVIGSRMNPAIGRRRLCLMPDAVFCQGGGAGDACPLVGFFSVRIR